MRFIPGHKARFGVEPICRVLFEHGCPIAPPTDYGAARRPALARARRDEQLTATVLAEAARLLDFRQPAAVLLISVLHLIGDQDGPHAIITRLMEAVPPGSWLALSHPARDVHPEQVTEAAVRFNRLAPAKATLHTRDQILRFFDGLDLLEHGLVQVHRWRPGLAAPRPQPAGRRVLRPCPQTLTRQAQLPPAPRRAPRIW